MHDSFKGFVQAAKTLWFIPLFIAYEAFANVFFASTNMLAGMPLILAMALSEALMFGPPVLLYLAIARVSPKKALFIKPLSLRNAGFVAAMVFFLLPIGMLISALSSLVFPNAAEEILSQLNSPLWLKILVIGLAPAIFEESAFRGALLHQASSYDFRVSAFISGMFFAAMHLNMQQFPYALFLGFIFALFTRQTGSILSSMLAHFLFNSTVVALNSVVAEPTGETSANAALYSIAFIAVISALCWTMFWKIYLKFSEFNKTAFQED
jgi:membrane protease YdiL (CAAX protease family)